jgi:hypothetical protein
MMAKTIQLTLSGIKRNIPVALLDAYKSIGWKILGADPTVKFEKPKTSQASSRTKKDKV